jgi:hypothetical protein
LSSEILAASVAERLGGYQLKQLYRLDWQLTRTLMTWGITLSLLLLTAFLGKASESYSRGGAIAGSPRASVVIDCARRSPSYGYSLGFRPSEKQSRAAAVQEPRDSTPSRRKTLNTLDAELTI